MSWLKLDCNSDWSWGQPVDRPTDACYRPLYNVARLDGALPVRHR
jgi:hypothetical protein